MGFLVSAFEATHWIIDTLLKKRSEDKSEKRIKWNQVADYTEAIANQIDSCMADFNRRVIPHSARAQLVAMSERFPEVLAQVYPLKDEANADTINEYHNYLLVALADLLSGHHAIDEEGDIILGDKYPEITIKLHTISGQFRGLAAALRATA